MADKKPNKTKNTKEEIEAALARATGAPMPTPVPCVQNLDQKKVDEALNDVKVPEAPELGKDVPPGVGKKNKDKSGYTKGNTKVAESENIGAEEPAEETPDKIAMSTEDFGRKCFNLDITASQAHYQSNKSKDPTIDEYLRGINKKIYDESRTGGFSTNVQFRVAPNDYVNVNHIIDWYKARGFQILNYNMTSVPYGNNAGLMEYNFQISWAEA